MRDKAMKTKERGGASFWNGFRKGIPIALGYLPVSFTFGFMASGQGLPVWLSVFISMSNLTSAGQFAGTNLILAGAGYLEIALTTFLINIRYMLMSLSITQKLKKGIALPKRMLLSFGITDEIFAVASVEEGRISEYYMYGLIIGPYFGWALGTLLGACASGVLPESVQNAMGIALYAMFIAIIIPPAKQSRPVILTILMAVGIQCVLRYVPFFGFISDGFGIILATICSAAVTAALFPIKEEESC